MNDVNGMNRRDVMRGWGRERMYKDLSTKLFLADQTAVLQSVAVESPRTRVERGGSWYNKL